MCSASMRNRYVRPDEPTLTSHTQDARGRAVNVGQMHLLFAQAISDNNGHSPILR
jgi:hypothetical protein